ncbi:MAG: TonB-dependent receptor [Desulfobacteraceae bacterium]
MRKFWFIGMGLIAVLGLGPDVRADEKVTMDTVVVTATKTEEQRKDVPNAVLIMDDADIQESPATSVGDLLGGRTGVDWRTRGDYGGAAEEIHIRGMGADGTQILVNGITVNSPSLGSADLGKIPMNAIDRIEVVKGSGSVLYGSGAMGGLVNIFTKDPKHGRMALKASAGYGTENTYQISAEQGMFAFGDFGYYVTANRTETDGFRDNSDLTQNDASIKLVLDKGKKLHIGLYGDIIDRENGRPGVKPPEGTVPFSVNGTMVYNTESANLLNRTSEKDTHLVLKVKSRPSDWMGLNFQTDYTTMESENDNRYYSSFTPGNLPGSKTEVVNEILGAEGNFEINPFQGATLLMGAQYKAYDWKNTSITLDGFGSETTRIKGDADLHTTGLFAEAQYRPAQYVKFSAGVRHEDHSEFGTEILPRYGLVVNPLENTTLKFNTGRHFKAPTPNDLFWPFEDWGFGSGAQGNPDLQPETGWHTDASLEQSLADERIFFSLTWFKWDIDDKIEWAPDSSFFYRPENLSHYEATGLETGLKIGPFHNTTLDLDYTYTDAKEQKAGGVKRQARYTVHKLFKAGLTYWFDFGLDVTATARYTDKRPASYANDTDVEPVAYLSSYWTLDLKGNQRLSDHWSLSCQVNNLFDESYNTYVETFYDQSGTGTLSKYPGAGRSIYVSASYAY